MQQQSLSYATEYHGQKISADSELEACEKETALNFSEEPDKEGQIWVTINTHSPTMMRNLLRCKFFETFAVEQKGKTKAVIGLTGRFPLGALSITRPRKDSSLSKIVKRVCLTRNLGSFGSSGPVSGGINQPKKGGPHQGTTSKPGREEKEAEIAWHRWVYGGERDPLLKVV